MDDHEFQTGVAIVTSQGLLFQNQYYSNPSMIKFGWFELAVKQGSWHIPIFFNELLPNFLYLLDIRSIEIATAIEHTQPLSNEEREIYYRNLATLKNSIMDLIEPKEENKHYE